MHIKCQPLLIPIWIVIRNTSPVKHRVQLIDDPVVIRADDHLVSGIIIQAPYKIINMMRFHNIFSLLLFFGQLRYYSIRLNSICLELCYYLIKTVSSHVPDTF